MRTLPPLGPFPASGLLCGHRWPLPAQLRHPMAASGYGRLRARSCLGPQPPGRKAVGAGLGEEDRGESGTADLELGG